MGRATKQIKKAVATPFHLCLDRMTEDARAKVIDDSLTYLGLADVAVPSQVLLATSFSKTDIDEALMIDKHDRFALLRPAFNGRITIDSVVGTSWTSFEVKTHVLKNNGQIDTELHRYSYDGEHVFYLPVISNQTYAEDLLRSVTKQHGVSAWLFQNEQARRTEYVIGFQSQVFAGLKKSRWTTSLSQSATELSIVTECGTLKEMFRLRERPEGKTRREALLHLVRGHWRKHPTTQDRIEVEKYLRGATEFEWFGLRAQVSTNGCDL